MTSAARSLEVKRRGASLGFAAVGIATLERNAHAAALERWLAAGYAGTMSYLNRQRRRRENPAAILPRATVAVVTLTNYCHRTPAVPRDGSPSLGRVAQYAWWGDYHRVIGQRLARLAEAIGEIAPGAETRCYVDAGPVPERELAERAGLGWVGKNMMLIRPDLGSFTFIGVVLTDAPLAPDLPFGADRCGSCRRCLDACPTDAFVEPHVMDARRCIAYLTIEQRGAFTTTDRQRLGEWVFGCDICQDVCPWNLTFARPTADAELAPRADLVAPDLALLTTIAGAEFDARFGDTPFARPGVSGMGRNARAVRANRAEHSASLRSQTTDRAPEGADRPAQSR